jgi:DNA-directed RNA polymerase subunit RPC12/RpoP
MGRGGGVLGDRIFWVDCVSCEKSFYCEYELLNSDMKLICPFCGTEFHAKESKGLVDGN